MATVADLSKVYEAIDEAMRETADINMHCRNCVRIINYIVWKYEVTKAEISQDFAMEEIVREFLSCRWGTNPGDSQCKQLFQYLIEEKMITQTDIDSVLETTQEVII